MIALERYAQGCSADNEELRFAAFVSGIDAVVTSFYSERDGGPMGQARRADAASFESERLQGVDKRTIQRIVNLLASPSFLDKFNFYAQSNSMDQRLIDRFSKVRNQRGDLFHGGRAAELGESALSAKAILEAIICIEANIDKRKTWRLDRRHKSVGAFQLPGMGWTE